MRVGLTIFALCVSLTLTAPVFGFDPLIDSPMYLQPAIPAPTIEYVFPPELKVLWLRALERPEVEMRLKAAGAIALARHRGMPGLDDTATALIAVLDAPEQHPAVRIAAAHALIALDARRAAPSLLAQAQAGDIELRQTVEPALAAWDHKPARIVWLRRLETPSTAARSLILAIDGLGVVREMQASARLRELAVSPLSPIPIRVSAAQALGNIHSDGLEPTVEKVLAEPQPRDFVSRLAAAHLLRRHDGPAAIAFLQRLARDSEPAVALVAAQRLLELGPEAALPVLDSLLASPGADVRALGVELLHRTPNPERIHLLAARLDDVHEDIRRQARKHLHDLAGNQAFRAQILDEAMRVLSQRDWRGLEQTAILLTQLDHRAAAERFVQLLSHDRPEVFVTAAWGLRKLAVAETLPKVQAYIESEYGRLVGKKLLPARKGVPDLIDHQLAQLNQLLGQQRFAPADKPLRQFIPKRDRVGQSRAAAIWALGLLHEGKDVPADAADIDKRLQDVGSIPPEDASVRRMAAITLGRMKATDALPTLRKFWTGKLNESPISDSCGWAIERITGEALPPPVIVRKMHRDWFLMP